MAPTSNSITLPPADVIAVAVSELIAAAHGDLKRIASLNKAQYDLTLGTRIVAVPGAFLIPSSSRSGVIHRIEHVTGECDCEAGRAGHQCRHKTTIEIIELAQARAIRQIRPLGERISAARAKAEMDELFG